MNRNSQKGFIQIPILIAIIIGLFVASGVGYVGVRHPPQSGWLDEWGRLKDDRTTSEISG